MSFYKAILLSCTFLVCSIYTSGGTITTNNAYFFVDPSVHMSFYPNPCPRILNVDVAFEKNISTIEIRIRSLIGKEMIEAKVYEKTNNSNHYEIDISDLSAGVYLLEVLTYNGDQASKITKRITKI